MVVFTSEDRSVVTKTAPAVDLQFFAGTFFMSISLLIFAIQILNPYGILGGIFYSLAGVKLLQNSNKGSKILDSIPVNTILLAKSQICHYFEDGSIVRSILEIGCAYLLHMAMNKDKSVASHSLTNTIRVSSKLERSEVKQKSRNIINAALASVAKEFPKILNRTKANPVHILYDLSNRGKRILVEECKRRSLDWVSAQYNESVAALSRLWYETFVQLYESFSNFLVMKSISVKNFNFIDNIKKPTIVIKKPKLDKVHSRSLPLQLKYCFSIVTTMSTNTHLRNSKTLLLQYYSNLVVVSIIVTNTIAFRLGIHPTSLSWFRNIILIRLLTKSGICDKCKN